jgi:hypothetical protein
MFVNFTHPSQIRDKKVKRRVKAFTSKQNQNRKRGHQTFASSDDSKICPIPGQILEEDDDKCSELHEKDPLDSSTQFTQYKNKPTDKISRSDIIEDLYVQESGCLSQATCDKSVPLLARMTTGLVDKEPEEILEVYPAVGNIKLPFSETNLSPQTAARLRRLTQFYVEVDGPTSIWRPQQLVESSKAHVFKRNFFAMSMAEPIIMEAVFAGSQLRLDLANDSNDKPSKFVLQHRGKVMEMIAERIKNPKKMLEDVTFFALIGMITLDAFLGNWISFKSNLDGFRMLVVLRGGIENLGWQGWFRSHLGWTEFQWATYKARNRLNTSMVPAYPRHPFPSALSVSVSKLPEGFREAALSRNLSIEVINLLRNVSSWTNTRDNEEPGIYYLEGLKSISDVVEVMSKYDISRSERIICIATVAYIIETDGRSKEARTPRGLEDHLLDIERLHSGLSLNDMLLWAAVVIAASNDDPKNSSANKWKVLDCIMDADMDNELDEWEDVKKRTRKFFWNESIETTWESCWRVALDRKTERTNGKQKGKELSMLWSTPLVYDVLLNQPNKST